MSGFPVGDGAALAVQPARERSGCARLPISSHEVQDLGEAWRRGGLAARRRGGAEARRRGALAGPRSVGGRGGLIFPIAEFEFELDFLPAKALAPESVLDRAPLVGTGQAAAHVHFSCPLGLPVRWSSSLLARAKQPLMFTIRLIRETVTTRGPARRERPEQVRMRREQVRMRREQARMRREQARMRREQARMRREQARISGRATCADAFRFADARRAIR